MARPQTTQRLTRVHCLIKPELIKSRLSPTAAVIAAHAKSVGDLATTGLRARYAPLLRYNRDVIGCGDYATVC